MVLSELFCFMQKVLKDTESKRLSMRSKSISDSDSEIKKFFLPCLDLLRASDFHLF